MSFIVSGSDGGTFPSWTTATRPASPAVGQMGYNTTTGLFDQYVAGAWQSVSIGTGAQPQVTQYTTGSGTYTTPTGAKYLFIQMVGGGGGGGGAGTAYISYAGGTGGTTTFGTSLLTCNGGVGGSSPNAGTGGAYTVNSPALGVGFGGTAGSGQSSNTSIGYMVGGVGGCSPFGGAGAQTGANNTPSPATANTGSGGSGGVTKGTPANYVGGGGGAGGYIQAIIPSPSATYSYAIGAAGTAGTTSAGANYTDGSAGAAGTIIVTAFF